MYVCLDLIIILVFITLVFLLEFPSKVLRSVPQGHADAPLLLNVVSLLLRFTWSAIECDAALHSEVYPGTGGSSGRALTNLFTSFLNLSTRQLMMFLTCFGRLLNSLGPSWPRLAVTRFLIFVEEWEGSDVLVQVRPERSLGEYGVICWVWYLFFPGSSKYKYRCTFPSFSGGSAGQGVVGTPSRIGLCFLDASCELPLYCL